MRSFFLWELKYFLGEEEWGFRLRDGYDGLEEKFSERIRFVPKGQPFWPYKSENGFYGYCSPEEISIKPLISIPFLLSIFRFAPVGEFRGRFQETESGVVLVGRFRAGLIARSFIWITMNLLIIGAIWSFIYGVYELIVRPDTETLIILILWIPWVLFMLWVFRRALRLFMSIDKYVFPGNSQARVRDRLLQNLVELTGDKVQET